MSLNSLLSRWRSDPEISGNIIAWQVQAPKVAVYNDFPTFLDQQIIDTLSYRGIFSLYSHQYYSILEVNDGNNVVISTSTASGKSLCYNIPILNALLADSDTRALYIFPTKALTQDQQKNLRSFTSIIRSSKPIVSNIYDGDTSNSERQFIRNGSNIIMTNPDMLHTGILPHHTSWHIFLSHLKFIVIDEVHTYRGVFGSHIANLIRRLKRVTSFYGSHPQFILTSATIGNPVELSEKLIEEKVTLIDQDGAPQGQRHFLIYNPPLIDQQLGIRKSSLVEGTLMATQMVENGVQTIIFGRTRRLIELILTYLRNALPQIPENSIRGYRSGYLREERREIEEGLRNGMVRAVAATSALELGIDIGDLEASLIIGFPGSIASARQQAGRAGRKSNKSLAILITAANALDQYLALHPEYFFERSPEQALVEPNNLLILMQHIRSATFELPFISGQAFGNIRAEIVAQFLDILIESGEVHQQGSAYYWIADKYPAADISLRSASPDVVSLFVPADNKNILIGQVDKLSAYWMVHPEAIYIHEGQTYLVNELDLERSAAYLQSVSLDYYTEPLSDVKIENYQVSTSGKGIGCKKFYGELSLKTQVTGYRKLRWSTREHIGMGSVDLPPSFLNTTGYWMSIEQEVIDHLREEMLWKSDPNDYGKDWLIIREKVLQRDDYKCKVCGSSSTIQPLHVHHIQPFKTFTTLEAANALSNLVTLCPSCHRQAEQNIRIRSGLAGATYVLGHIAPLLIMCDSEDIGILSDPVSPLGDGQPTIIIYDNVPGGIGLSERLFDQHLYLLKQGLETISVCQCADGCPSCVGPIGEEGYGGKKEALALLKALV